jgi:hypothetical protein
MGNRGCLHDQLDRPVRQYQSRRWIICVLEFKGRRHPIMYPGRYTELFFLDEATALAAGHRPCAECQRDRFNLFRELWAKGNPELTNVARPTTVMIDSVLHRERTASTIGPRGFQHAIGDLPNGTFVTNDEQTAYLVFDRQIWQWQPDGYQRAATHIVDTPLKVLTPVSIVRALSAGYPVSIHPSTWQA